MQADRELLNQYVKNGSEAAFAELVRRYVRLVYSVALRQIGSEAHLAEDTTQTVFIILARKAHQLTGHETLVGWLHTTTRHIALSALRDLYRRQAREQEAFTMETNSSPPVPWEQLRPLLDEAVGRLNDLDRQAVLLRYFQGWSHREVGETLGLTEDAARVRVNRAVEKLRQNFGRRGIVTTGALLAETISAHAMTTEPAGLAGQVTVATFAQAKELGVGQALLKTIFMTTQTKFILAGVIIMMLAAIPLAIPHPHGASNNQAGVPQNASGSLPKTAPSSPKAATAQVAAPMVAPAKVIATQTVAAAPLRQAVNPRAPMPGVYPKRASMRDLFSAVTGRDQSTGPIVMNGPVIIPTADMIRFRYSNFIQKMQFTSEQTDAFVNILTDEENQENAIRQQNALPPQALDSLRNTADGQVSAVLAEHQLQLAPQIQAVEQNATAQLEPLLGSEDNVNYYETYNDQAKERAVIDGGGYTDALNTAGVPPLTLDQEENLVNLVYQYRTAANGNPIPPEQQTQILEQAQTFISSAQLTVFQQFLPMLSKPPPAPGTVNRAG